MKILMVCLGNICRSPIAEGILNQMVINNDLDWEVDSCGTSGWHDGEAPDSRSIKITKQNGINISMQISRGFTKEDLDKFDLILPMDTSNYNELLKKCTSESHKSKLKLILNFAFPGENRVVPDPYYEGGFPLVFDLLHQACAEIVKEYG